MFRIALLALVIAACKGTSDDCAIVRDKPASALAELTRRYPNDAVKVAQTIETCVAPTGDECERSAKVIAAIPAMAPHLTVPGFDAAKTCREAPPAFRRCMLPSYMLAHEAECRAAVTQAITEVEVKPSTRPAQPAGDCGTVAIYLDGDGTWLATGRDATAWCFAPNKAGAPDTDWLEAQLRRAKAHPCGPSASEIAADDDVPYQHVIAAMDTSVKTGFMDTGLSSPAAMAAPLTTADPRGAASECPATLIPYETGDTDGPAAPPPSVKDALKSAPVLIVTKTEVSVSVNDAKTVIATTADAGSGKNLAVVRKALTDALPAARDGLLILQADQSTPTRVINMLVETAKADGYDNILFAVKNR
jgi:biopolymer transport protein ExbD